MAQVKYNGLGARQWFEQESAKGSFSGNGLRHLEERKAPSAERPRTHEIRVNGEWRVVATWPDGSKTLHARYEVYPTRENGVEYLEAHNVQRG